MAFRIIWCDGCNKEVGRVQKTGKTPAQVERLADQIKARHFRTVNHPFGERAVPSI